MGTAGVEEKRIADASDSREPQEAAALVTDSARNIGLAIALDLADAGAAWNARGDRGAVRYLCGPRARYITGQKPHGEGKPLDG